MALCGLRPSRLPQRHDRRRWGHADLDQALRCVARSRQAHSEAADERDAERQLNHDDQRQRDCPLAARDRREAFSRGGR
jgi:hypothetical protein